jgi:hypothetical protein
MMFYVSLINSNMDHYKIHFNENVKKWTRRSRRKLYNA